MYHIRLVLVLFINLKFISSATFLSSRENVDEKDKIDALENNALIEGDIIPNLNENGADSISKDGKTKYHSIAQRSFKWPKGIIYFKLDKHFYDDEVKIILSSMLKIERVSCIRFRPYRPIDGPDYVKIIKGPGCFSSAGRIGGMQSLSLGKGCVNIGTVIHEMMHSIGFYHHHMRPDRDAYLKIHYENIRNEYKTQFNKLKKSESKLMLSTPFDYQSIMIYGSKAFSKNNKATMTAKAKKVKLTYPFNKTKLSRNDVVALNKLYKCSSNKNSRKSSLIFYSEPESEENEESSEIDFPKLDELNEKIEKEKQEKEKIEKEKQEKEKQEKEKIEKEKQEKEKQEKEKLEKEKLEKAKKEKAKIEKEKLEKAKIEKAKIEKAKIEKEKLEKEKKEKLEKEKLRKTKLVSIQVLKKKKKNLDINDNKKDDNVINQIGKFNQTEEPDHLRKNFFENQINKLVYNKKELKQLNQEEFLISINSTDKSF